jgi:hypothetical protein
LIMLLNNGDTVFTSFLTVKQLISGVFHLTVVSSLERGYSHLPQR